LRGRRGAAMEAVLGDALTQRQLARTLTAVAGFWAVQVAADLWLQRVVPREYGQLSVDDRRQLTSYFTSMAHALAVSFLCVGLVAFPDGPIERDRVYGRSDRANLAFSTATAFFLYDLRNLRSSKGVEWTYVYHHSACALCYALVQHPFLAYYAVRLLLYELSTPFLNVRQGLVLLGRKSSPVLPIAEKLFGYSFLIIRLAMGLPLSYMALRDARALYQSGRQHSTAVMAYFVVANLGLNGLNLFWSYMLIRKRLKQRRGGHDDKKEQ
jgi:hypothetical protein